MAFGSPPQTPDCFTIIKCKEAGKFKILISELKSGAVDDVKSKFETAVKDFIEKRFMDIFLDGDKVVHAIDLVIVSNKKADKASVRRSMLAPIKLKEERLLIIQKPNPLIIEDCAPLGQ